MSSRPLPGVLISLREKSKHRISVWKVLVPFPGFLYLYYDVIDADGFATIVLVPFSGFLYLYLHICTLYLHPQSSRPLLGVLISLQKHLEE